MSRSHLAEAEPLSREFLEKLQHAQGHGKTLTDAPSLEAYAWDNTAVRMPPQAVVLAEDAQRVASVLKLCSHYGVPVVPRGAGSGNVGGALALRGGVVLSTQRMNQIVEINPADRLAVVEPGVINGDLQDALADTGLFWPPDPSSSKSCSIGGNLAMCSAGPGAVRHGVTRDWVLGLEAVTTDGQVIKTGSRTTKGVVGYDLTRLLIGSEGTLAVITRATLKLAPRPAHRRLMRLLFAHVTEATQAVVALMSQGTPPSAIEFMDGGCLDLLRSESDLDIPPQGKALLLLEVSGSRDEVIHQSQRMAEAVDKFHPLEVVTAQSDAQAAQVWEARHALSPILKKRAPKRVNEDVVVPISRLPELIDGLQALSRDSDIPILNFGHAGNGNIHVNLLIDPADNAVMARLDGVVEKLFRLVLQLEGTLSGEHGVGMQKRDYLPWEIDSKTLDIQRRIQSVFDPKGILNPGKIFPE